MSWQWPLAQRPVFQTRGRFLRDIYGMLGEDARDGGGCASAQQQRLVPFMKWGGWRSTRGGTACLRNERRAVLGGRPNTIRTPAVVGFGGARTEDVQAECETSQEGDGAVEQSDEADEAFAGTMASWRCRLMPAPSHY